MKSKLLFITVLLACFGIINASESVAFTLQVKGEVELTRQTEKSAVLIGDKLINKDILESLKESFAAVKFIDGSSVIKLFPNSILTINTEKNKKLNKKSYLKIGELWAKVMKKTGKFEVDTPTTVISVKGTEFLLSVNEKGETFLYTLEGAVVIKNKQDGREATVGAGEKGYSDGSGEIIVSQIQPGDIDPGTQEMIKSGQVLEINLKNKEGERRTIRFDLE